LVALGETGRDLASEGLVLTYNATSPANVVIDGKGREVDLSGNATGPLITVETGVTLTLENITLKGLKSDFDAINNDASLIWVKGGGTLILQGDAVIRDNNNVTNGNDSGGGVCVHAGGVLTMEGGKISGNGASRGGGVFVHGGGQFTMNGGEISGNRANDGGGVLTWWEAGRFDMYGGIISNNTAERGGGVFVFDDTQAYSHDYGTFFKYPGGIIYGSDGGPLSNIATDASNAGHAVRTGYPEFADYGVIRIRDQTAGENENISIHHDAEWGDFIGEGDWVLIE
jgi:hypothetical protein